MTSEEMHKRLNELETLVDTEIDQAKAATDRLRRLKIKVSSMRVVLATDRTNRGAVLEINRFQDKEAG